jgi:hypothetical protein
MAFIPRRTILLVAPLALCLVYSGCAFETPERREAGQNWPAPDESASFSERTALPPGVFDVECRFGISGCEAQASERCGYAGFHVFGSYRTQSVLGWPYYYMRAGPRKREPGCPRERRGCRENLPVVQAISTDAVEAWLRAPFRWNVVSKSRVVRGKCGRGVAPPDITSWAATRRKGRSARPPSP